MIGIVDYKAGNSHSVYNACVRIEQPCMYIRTAKDLEQVSAIILPGVGSAGATMESLEELGIIEELEHQVLELKKPFLGICVGLQILFEHSDEGDVDCLGWLKGKVVGFDNAKVRVPQIGWNELEFQKESPITKGLSEHSYFYFVNSFYAVPSNQEDVLAVSDYNGKFTAMVQHENIYASQCHIEKSGEIGLKVLRQFCELGGGCAC